LEIYYHVYYLLLIELFQILSFLPFQALG